MTARETPEPLKTHPVIAQWIAFRADGTVEVRSGRVELGQGNGTALAQIVADELDVPMERLRLVAGDTRSTPDEGFTAGSFSVQRGGMALRYAASAARMVLLREAGTLLQTRPELLTVRDGRIVLGDRQSDLDYWTLAGGGALDLPVMDYAAPKPVAARTVADTSVHRTDLADKMLGKGFIHDMVLPGMLHGRVVHAPAYRQRLLALDTARIEALPGVVTVVRDGSFVGILAEREEQAARALEVAEREARWSEPPAVRSDVIAEIEAAAPPAETVYRRGTDAPHGRRHATRVTRQMIAHASIAPSCALARMTDGRLTVWSHTQGPHPLRNALAAALRITPEAIDVIHVDGAGCYGHNPADDAALDAALLARAAGGRPVRLQWSRGDELGAGPFGPAAVVRAEAVTGDDGRIAAFGVDVLSQPVSMRPGRNGTPNLLSAESLAEPVPASPGGDLALTPGGGAGGADRNAVPTYAVPHVRVTKAIARHLPYRTSSLRALGGYLNVFAIETLMDDVAADLGEDPVAFRLAHLDDPRARAVVARTAEMAGWPGEMAEGTGQGLAFARYKTTAAYCAVAVRVVVDEAVRVTHAWAALDAGECVNPDGARHQLEGSIVQAISWALKEAVRVDGAVPASRDWDGYPILPFSQVPEIRSEIIQRQEDPPLGLAEAAMGPTAAAIGNALFRGLGVRVRDLPLSHDTVCAAVNEGEGR